MFEYNYLNTNKDNLFFLHNKYSSKTRGIVLPAHNVGVHDLNKIRHTSEPKKRTHHYNQRSHYKEGCVITLYPTSYSCKWFSFYV